MEIMRALLYSAAFAVLILGLNTKEPSAKAYADSSDTKNEQTIVIPVRPHILKPGPNGKEQIGDVSGNPDEGKPIYQKYCIFCHGESGRGDGIAATGLQPSPADLTETFSRWGPLDGEAARMVDQYVFEVITYGIEGSYQLEMPPWGPSLSKQDRVNVITYLKVITNQPPDTH